MQGEHHHGGISGSFDHPAHGAVALDVEVHEGSIEALALLGAHRAVRAGAVPQPVSPAVESAEDDDRQIPGLPKQSGRGPCRAACDLEEEVPEPEQILGIRHAVVLLEHPELAELPLDFLQRFGRM